MKCPHCDKEIDLGAVPVPEGFEMFWDMYPKKVARPAAIRAWKKLDPSIATRSAMRLALLEAKRSEDWKKQRGAFIPYPATWLNQRRWEDEGVPVENEWVGIEVGSQEQDRADLERLRSKRK